MENKHYEALISYRHVSHDKAIAERLQVLLEKYSPPRKGVYTNTQRIKRIFRDESELHSVGNLSAGIKEALRNSDFLIVVCSEETKKSEWCLEEIDYFKELHYGKTDRIMALLAKGDPNLAFPDLLCFLTLIWRCRQKPSYHSNKRV